MPKDKHGVARRCARCGKYKEDIKYRSSTGLWLCDDCFKLWVPKSSEASGETVPSLREMVVSKTYPGAPSGIQITVFPTRSFSHPDKFSLFSSTENVYFGKLKDTFQEAVEGANKENIRMYGTPTEAIIEEAKRRERVVGTQDLYWLSVDELKAMCRRKNLPDSGNKNDLVQRLKK